VSSVPLEPYGKLPVIIGLDFGRTPAAIFGQMMQDGHIQAQREAVAFDLGFDAFIKYHIRPILRTQYPTNPIVFIGDPAGAKRNDTDEGSCMKLVRDAFKGEGATVKGASTNFIAPRLEAVERMLMYHPDGTPLLQIDPSCRWLIEGLRSKYRYALVKDRDADHRDLPDKNKWSHICDAFQYFGLFLMGGKYDPGFYVRQDIVEVSPMDFMFPKAVQRPTYAGY
jgi:hypothetical protein